MPPAEPEEARPSLRLPPLFLAWIDGQIETLYPGSFAVVMATGVISNALFIDGSHGFSDLLLRANALAFLWLAILTTLRAVRFPRALWSDLINPRLVFTFFTLVAGSNVLGESLDLRGLAAAAFYLWLFALVVWFVLIYLSFAVLMFLNAEHGADVIHGGWLLAIVGTESLAVLGTAVALSTDSIRPAVFVLAHMLWGVGLGLYAVYMTLFIYRIFFFEIEPDDVTPALWVIMGAAAISANAGSALILTNTDMRFLQVMLPFVDGVTLIIWAWATFWIPVLLLFGIWKHWVRGVPLTYTPLLWSIVFPLGMYSVATVRLSLASSVPGLQQVSHAMLWIAVAAWAVGIAALAATSWHSFHEFARSRLDPNPTIEERR
jgi:tellurite resistance protein TehA-like permease